MVVWQLVELNLHVCVYADAGGIKSIWDNNNKFIISKHL